MTSPQDIFSTIQQNRHQAATAWKAAGGKVVGYVSNAIPLEIIHAAGMLPLHLSGDPQIETPLADRFMEPAFDPLSRSIMQRLLAGDFDFIDLLVLPRSNDAYQRLYYYLCELHRKHPEFSLPPVYLLDLLHSPRETTAAHNIKKLRDFVSHLATFTECSITEADLAGAIHNYNEAREQLRRFSDLRSQPDLNISGALAHSVYTAAQSLPIQVFTIHLALLNETLARTKPENISSKRVVIAGNGLDHPALHQHLDMLGIEVVGDYHSFGNHFLVSRVDEATDPLLALNRHYHSEIKSTRRFMSDPSEVVDFARQQNASGIIFFYLQGEEALTWHYPSQRKAAEQAGLATLLLSEQPYLLKERLITESLLNERGQRVTTLKDFTKKL